MFNHLLHNAWTSAWTVCGLLDVCYYYEWLYARALCGLIAMYVRKMSRGNSRLMVFHTSLYFTSRATPHLVLLHVSWKWTFPQKIIEFHMWISARNHAWTATHEWSYTWAIPYILDNSRYYKTFDIVYVI